MPVRNTAAQHTVNNKLQYLSFGTQRLCTPRVCVNQQNEFSFPLNESEVLCSISLASTYTAFQHKQNILHSEKLLNMLIWTLRWRRSFVSDNRRTTRDKAGIEKCEYDEYVPFLFLSLRLCPKRTQCFCCLVLMIPASQCCRRCLNIFAVK